MESPFRLSHLTGQQYSVEVPINLCWIFQFSHSQLCRYAMHLRIDFLRLKSNQDTPPIGVSRLSLIIGSLCRSIHGEVLGGGRAEKLNVLMHGTQMRIVFALIALSPLPPSPPTMPAD